MNRFYRALEAKYQAKIEEALATLDLYFNKSVGVGEHPDIVEVLDNYLDMLDDNRSKLETLRNLFDTVGTKNPVPTETSVNNAQAPQSVPTPKSNPMYPYHSD